MSFRGDRHRVGRAPHLRPLDRAVAARVVERLERVNGSAGRPEWFRTLGDLPVKQGQLSVEQINNEDERLAGQSMSTRFAVCETWRNDQLTAATYLHPRNTLLPTGDQAVEWKLD